jgi:hypothetical protein
MSNWKIDPQKLVQSHGDCPHCGGFGTVLAAEIAAGESEGATRQEACERCGGIGFAIPWPWPGAEVFYREYEIPGEGWRRVREAFPDPWFREPACVRFSPDSGQRKANVFNWRVRDLDREGNVVREYKPA